MLSDALKPLSHRALLRTSARVLNDTSKAFAFENPQVKSLLRRLTGRNLDKVLTTRRERGIESPSYKLMTDEELAMVSVIHGANALSHLNPNPNLNPEPNPKTNPVQKCILALYCTVMQCITSCT